MSDVYRLRKRYDVLTYLQGRIPLDPTYEDFEYEVDNEHKILNRASVVTVFGRREKNFDMLFTGDAYDQEADIIHSIAMWKEGLVSGTALFKFNVMKIPHHGSARTTHAQFYQAVRADVYIVCAQHSTHGNPRVSSLQAIVEGFENNPVCRSSLPQELKESFNTFRKKNEEIPEAESLYIALYIANP